MQNSLIFQIATHFRRSSVAASSIAILLASVLFAGAEENLSVTYLLDDFEQTRPTGYSGRPEAKVKLYADNIHYHDGKQGIGFAWDLTQSSQPRQNFSQFNFNHCLAGKPESIAIWVFATDAEVGTSLRLILADAGKETYICESPVTMPGWQKIVFSLRNAKIPYRSGDGNRIMDHPLSTVGLRVENGKKGSLTIDEATAVTRGTSRDMVLPQLSADQTNGIGWGKSPTFTLNITNPAPKAIRDISVNLSAKDALSGIEVWKTRASIEEVAQRKTVAVAPELSNGVYTLSWVASDAAGELPLGSGTLRIARMAGDVSHAAHGPAERDYMLRYGPIGGIYWSCTPERAAQTGATWRRQGENWKSTEVEPGRFDFTKAVEEANATRSAGEDFIYFNTLYTKPKFYTQNDSKYAAAFGSMHRELARAMDGIVRDYELGNEDNGPTKYLYTEVARNGAAGVRGVQPYAYIFNSGCAGIDVSWLRAQADRGLFKSLDGLVTHPYTWGSSPESFDLLANYAQIDNLIDELGGMKIQLSTEFGYTHIFDQRKRAIWTPRHFAIDAAAGLWKQGLYAWDNHFGIYDHGNAYPVAASVNAFALLTYGHHFAGWYQRDTSAWVAVYERAGIPLAMAWAPSGDGRVSLGGDSSQFEMFDTFGNQIKAATDSEEIVLGEAPIYIRNVPAEVLVKARLENAGRAAARLAKNLKESSFENLAEWHALSGATGSFERFASVLTEWAPTQEVSLKDQSVIAQAVRIMLLAAEAEKTTDKANTMLVDSGRRQDWQKHLEASVADDVDLPSLRWLLRNWEQTQSLIQLSLEAGNPAYAASLQRTDSVFDHLCSVFEKEGQKTFFPIWPYLYAPTSADTKIHERLNFTVGKAMPVGVRLKSYSASDYQGTVRLNLPSGWQCEPKQTQLTIKPGEPQEIIFQVTASETIPKQIVALLEIDGKPSVEVPYTDFEVFPSVSVSPSMLSELLPEGLLPLKIINNGTHPIRAKVRLVENATEPALARGIVNALGAGKEQTLNLKLPLELPRPPFNEWKLKAQVFLNKGKTLDIDVPVDFDVCLKAVAPVHIDGNLDEWQDAAPLHIDKPEYTQGSFGSGWSKEDCSAIVYTKWDENNFYIAVDVTDQVFNQELAGSDVWNQDSIQVAIAGDSGHYNEFSLALTPKGPQVGSIAGQPSRGPIKNAQLFVKLASGHSIYEAAIPWAALPGAKPTDGSACRFDIVVNDDDAIVTRRYMERYGMGIVHTKKINDLGRLVFHSALAEKSLPDAEQKTHSIFYENFEEYEPDKLPDTWKYSSHIDPSPEVCVRAGQGRNGGKCLWLRNTIGRVPNRFACITRQLQDLIPGKNYRLSAWVKGPTEKTKHVIGICSSQSAYEGFSNIGPWKPSNEWQKVEMEFEAPAGKMNVFILNDAGLIENLLIDDVTIDEISD